MKVAVLGFGREGRSVLKFLKKSPAWRKAEIEILDRKFNKDYLKNLKRFAVVFRSPGVPYNLSELKKARASGVKFSSATKLFFSAIGGSAYRRRNIKVIGITGTKGKGTTATLLYKMLRAAKKPALLGGNIGKSPLDLIPSLGKNSVVVLELSSFQLQDLDKSPDIAVVLDVFPDHQDAHLSLKEYYKAKTNITKHQKPGDKIFFFSAKGGSASGGKYSALSRWVAQESRGRKFAVDEKKFKLFGPEDLKIKGWHNFKNAMMAATVALNLGIPKKTIINSVKKFSGLEHRLEFVRRIKNIIFYNDSASTNPQTAAAALKAFPAQPKILIAGGQDKGLSYAPLTKAIKNSGTKLVILMGENKYKIRKAIENSGVRTKLVGDLRAVVKAAYKSTKTQNLKPETCVLFSPGAASFDMFKNYSDRGVQFKKLVKGLK